MTRKEILHWAEDTVKKVFHGHSHSQTFDGVVDFDGFSTVITLAKRTKHGKLCIFFPDLDDEFEFGDKVEITIRKK